MDKYITTIQIPILDTKGKESTFSLQVHKKLASEFQALFADLKNAGFRINKKTTKAYQYRHAKVNGHYTNSLSQHAYGAAIDVNWNVNLDRANGKTKDGKPIYNPNSTKPMALNDKIVRIFHKHGFTWGGCFGDHSDTMHFNWTGPVGVSDRYAICKEDKKVKKNK